MVGVKKDFTDKTITTSILGIVPMNADWKLLSWSDSVVIHYEHSGKHLTSGVYEISYANGRS